MPQGTTARSVARSSVWGGHLPKREELGLLTVVALPRHSKTGFESMMRSERVLPPDEGTLEVMDPPACAERQHR